MTTWLTEVWPWLLLGGFAAAFGVYLAVVLRDADDLDQPERGLADAMERRKAARSPRATPAKKARPKSKQARVKQKQPRVRTKQPREAPAPATAPPPPVLRPPAGSVASSTSAGGGMDPSRLLRTLDEGPDVRRQAAAKALSIPFAGSGDSEIGLALVELFRRTDVGDSVRAEAYVALRVVIGEDLEWEQELAVRQRFPEGVDLDWVDQVDADLAL